MEIHNAGITFGMVCPGWNVTDEDTPLNGSGCDGGGATIKFRNDSNSSHTYELKLGGAVGAGQAVNSSFMLSFSQPLGSSDVTIRDVRIVSNRSEFLRGKNVKIEIPILVHLLNSRTLSSTSSKLDNTLWV